MSVHVQANMCMHMLEKVAQIKQERRELPHGDNFFVTKKVGPMFFDVIKGGTSE